MIRSAKPDPNPSPLFRWGVTAVNHNDQPIYFTIEAPSKSVALTMLTEFGNVARVRKVSMILPLTPRPENP